MKVITILLCMFVAVTAFADVKIVQRVKAGSIMGQKPQDGNVTIYLKGQKARVENQDASQYQILDLPKGMMYMVDPSKKEVVAISTAQMKQAAEMVSKLMGGKTGEPPTVQKLGSTKTYNGYKCEEVKVTMTAPVASSALYCISPEIQLEKELEGLKGFSDEFSRMFGGDVMKQISGYPVHADSTVTVMGQTIKTTSDLVSYSRDSLADSLFVVPADYKVKEASIPNPNQ